MLFDVTIAEGKFRKLVGPTVANDLLKRMEKPEAQNLNAERIVDKVNKSEVGKKYAEIAENVTELMGEKGIVYLLSTRPHTSSNSNFVKLVKNYVVNNQTLKFYMGTPELADSSTKTNVNAVRNRLLRYLKLTNDENDDQDLAQQETNADLKAPLTRIKNENLGEKMQSYRKVNRLKVIVTALLINLINWADKKYDEAKQKQAEEAKKKAEEAARKREEEEKKRKAEEAKKREEEERRRREAEEAKKREEEEKKRQQAEAQVAAAKKAEEERRRREAEEAKKREEEERRRREAEEAKKREEEERRRREVEEAKKKAEEEKKKQQAEAQAAAAKKAEEEKKRREAEEAKKKGGTNTNNSDPGIFKNLPNDGNYCYLNTALQNLYYNKAFSDKVLNSERLLKEKDIPENDDIYVQLRATIFFFKYLSGKLGEREFNAGRKSKAVDLGHKVVDGTTQRNSSMVQADIERDCLDQIRLLKGEASRVIKYDPKDLNNPQNSETGDDDIWKDFLRLYHDQELCKRITNVGEDQLSEEDLDLRSPTLVGFIWRWFKQGEGQFGDLKDVVVGDIKTIRQRFGKKDFEYDYVKRTLEQWLNRLEREKRAYLLTQDSKITVANLGRNVAECLSKKFDCLQPGKAFYLPLKNRQFTVELNDKFRAQDVGKNLTEEDMQSFEPYINSNSRDNFSVEQELDLSKFINLKKLKVFIKNKEQEASKCKFKLISVTIATGGHYYLYRRIGSGWKRFNDLEGKDAVICNWEEVQKEAAEQGELLTYELKN